MTRAGGNPARQFIAAAVALLAASAFAQQVSPGVLRGHVSFLASDALEGRLTPSRGGDLAAEYIASQFRSIGLEEPAPGYFQRTSWLIEFTAAGETLRLRPDQIAGEIPSDTLAIGRRTIIATAEEFPKYKEKPPRSLFVVGDHPIPGAVVIRSPELLLLRKKGPVSATFVPQGLKNVVGLLRGTSDEYVIVSAHYDHLGARPSAEGVRVFNGANDDASGVAGLLETARVLAARRQKPLRSMVFLAFFGEEEGLVGSRYYAREPVFPIANTVAQLNLEQLGRTDDSEGARIRAINLTGFPYSNIPQILASLTPRTGVRVEDPGKNGEAYFTRSDNEGLAELGIPAHTVSVAYEFPDYHEVTDDWEKLDYLNLAAVTRLVAEGVWALANREQRPRWNEDNPTARKFAAAGTATRRAKSPAVSDRVSGSSPAIRRPPPRKQSQSR